MTSFSRDFIRITVTAAAVAVAAFVAWQLWVYYMEETWTRDGRVRADVVGVAPDVSYFEETKLPRIRPGDPATIRLLGEDAPLKGHVESIAAGIEDRERPEGASLLPNVNPTFSWVPLAQRIPVRVALDQVPPDVRLVAG
jgi:multidrug resistance efflux pump